MARGPDIVKNLWQEYLTNGTLLDARLHPVISRSWERCTEFKVDPFKVNTDQFLRGQAFRQALDQHETLTQIAFPIMSELYTQLKGTNTVILLVAPSGYILKSIGDLEISEKINRINLIEGANWLESVKGTNAIGTALAEQAPVRVLGQEHFVQPIQYFSCFCAPIMDPKGKLAGVIDATVFSKDTYPHTMALVLSAARTIEKQLVLDGVREEVLIAYKKADTLSEAMPEGLVSVDQSGLITQINTVGAKLLGMRAEECIGRKADQVLTMTQPLDRLDTSANTSLSIISKTNARLISRVRSISDSRGHPHGFVIIFRGSDFGAAGAAKDDRPRPGRSCRYSFADIIGNCEVIQTARNMARRAAQTSSTVLLLGETGTGKELFAQAIHSASARADAPFIAVNCGAIPDGLIESELFGYQDGAFTGARRGGNPGKFELAHGGTLFLDEIGDMPLQTQVSLLRVLQERQVTRVGGTRSTAVDVRVIAATHKDLTQAAREGRFRLDLFYRLNVVSIHIPPLRERGSDIIEMANLFLERLRTQYGLERLYLSQAAKEQLQAHRWPGNVRELENVLERAVNVADGAECLLPDHLPDGFFRTGPARSKADTPTSTASLRDVEYRTITDSLRQFEGNVSQAAKSLGIARNTFYRKLKRLNVDIDAFISRAERDRGTGRRSVSVSHDPMPV